MIYIGSGYERASAFVVDDDRLTDEWKGNALFLYAQQRISDVVRHFECAATLSICRPTTSYVCKSPM